MFLTLIDPLVVTFNETCAPTSRENVAKQGIIMPNWSKTIQTFCSHSSVFPLEKEPKNIFFQNVFTSNRLLVATLNETGPPTSRETVAKQDIVMPNWSKIFQTFRSHSFPFALEKQPKNLDFQRVFIFKRTFGGYFQWNTCTYFQKICSWARYNDAKLIENVSNFLVALLCFFPRKTT